jgi:hypothetical protein
MDVLIDEENIFLNFENFQKKIKNLENDTNASKIIVLDFFCCFLFLKKRNQNWVMNC